MVLNESHHVTDIFHGKGAYTIEAGAAGSRYAVVAIRTLVDADNTDDLAEVARLQDELSIDTGPQEPFTLADYEPATFDATRKALLNLAAGVSATTPCSARSTKSHPCGFICSSAPHQGGAVYQPAKRSTCPSTPIFPRSLRAEHGERPRRRLLVRGIQRRWLLRRESAGSYSVNSVTGTRNDDGSVTVRFVPTGTPAPPNSIPIPEGWNYMIRLYQPHPEILNGSWMPPTASPSS